MKAGNLIHDPYNAIITGVGGQGNVMASRILGNILSRKGCFVTIGETFGVSQRGGSVMSHLRISKQSVWSPQIPRGQAHIVVALEPTEAIRVLAAYGNPAVRVLSNTRPIHPVGVIAGELAYPSLDEIRTALGDLASDVALIDATDEAMKLGQAILGNVIMLGAVSGAGVLPFDAEDFRDVISETMSGDKVEINMKAFSKGEEMIRALRQK
ncbi:MAG TPA: indolepyruvate oxidoreductase subunit beta [Spirochaetota bacterium]|nr:indolepyruvate oxidoreductase subunit beta [Spirochaetota bacterium]HPC40482.1 indolepyruvate oxidoreductase subunit beta [Spirochaetota bacterium]HPL15779.1 indolepyruvate oxidoreductase subunit beta [Spirochaetota bacterium]HQF06549.1 indolepyruvate oxidoreductase subunit beta [Spirochaetota bacterium]HQH96048.1 indolepyruvate oxidoreductase subunit beta [Spirochaetota bacterium]